MSQRPTISTPGRRAPGTATTLTLAGLLAVLVSAAAWHANGATVEVGAVGQTPAAVAAAATPVTAPPGVTSYAPIVAKVSPTVVTIRTESKPAPSPTGAPDSLFEQFFGRNIPGFRERRGPARGLGSGVVVTPDGYVLTNNHVVDDAERIRVELPDRRVLEAKLVGADPPSDLAVLKVNAQNLQTLPFGDSSAVRVGDVVLAVGNPLGVGQTVTMGIVSAKGRATGLGDGSFEDFLQTDAPINQGNSGGPLVNTSGQLIGINSQILTPSGGNIGLGFAIPSNMARNVMDQLVKDGKVRRSRLGVTVQAVTADIAASLGLPEVGGALVSNVEAGSPAANAGLREGDVIVGLQGRRISDSNELRNEIAGMTPGSSVSLDVQRDGGRQTITAKLAELETKREQVSTGSEESGHGRFGMAVEPLTPELAARLELPPNVQGVVVTDMDPSGAAAEAGIREGDVIVRANGQPVRSAGELRSALAAATEKPVLVLVNRQGSNLFLALRAPRG